MTNDEELQYIKQVTDRLDTRFSDVSRGSVEQVVHSAHGHFGNGKVRDFMLLLVERAAREKLPGLMPS